MRARQVKVQPLISEDVELKYLAQLVGNFIEYWGFKKVQGEVWTYLFLSNHAWDASQIMSRLGISKSLTSQTLSVLQHYQVILPVEKSAAGTKQYAANPDPTEAILLVLKTRERRLLAQISSAQRLAADLPDPDLQQQGMDPNRLHRLGRLIAVGELVLNQVSSWGGGLASMYGVRDE